MTYELSDLLKIIACPGNEKADSIFNSEAREMAQHFRALLLFQRT